MWAWLSLEKISKNPKILLNAMYVTEIAALPDVTSKYIHHMILQAVEEVAFHRSYKALGNVPQDNPPVPTYGDTFRCKHQPPVARGADEVTYYAWARDAGPLILPRNSGFKIPRGWSILLEVHFLTTPPMDSLQPGLQLKTQFSIPSEIVGTYRLVLQELHGNECHGNESQMDLFDT